MFSLIDEAWIPCRMRDGSSVEMGLRRLVEEMGDVSEILDGSPIVTVALHRVVLAALARSCWPEDADAWARAFARGKPDADPALRYLERMRPRLDLFGDAHPFLQDPSIPATACKWPAHKLIFTAAPAGVQTLWSSVTRESPVTVPAGVAARHLCAYQQFMMCGTTGNGTGGKQGCLTGRSVVVAKWMDPDGHESLWRSMLLNMPPGSPRRDDLPAWERDDRSATGERAVAGPCDALTSTCRRMRLTHGTDANGAPMADGMTAWVGSCWPKDGDGAPAPQPDPMLAWVASENGAHAVWFDVDRARWRDAHAILRASSDESRRAPCMQWVAEAAGAGLVPWDANVRLDVLGFCGAGAQQKPVFMAHDRMRLPLAYLDAGRDALDRLADAIHAAEAVGRAVWSCAYGVVAEMRPGAKPKALRDATDGMAPSAHYWCRLEAPFRRLMADIPSDVSDAECGRTHGARVIPQWLTVVRGAAVESLDMACRRAYGSAHATGPITMARVRLLGAIKSIYAETARVEMSV